MPGGEDVHRHSGTCWRLPQAYLSELVSVLSEMPATLVRSGFEALAEDKSFSQRMRTKFEQALDFLDYRDSHGTVQTGEYLRATLNCTRSSIVFGLSSWSVDSLTLTSNVQARRLATGLPVQFRGSHSMVAVRNAAVC